MLITILAGTYFYITYCSECGGASVAEEPHKEAVMTAEPDAETFPFGFNDGDNTGTAETNM